MMNLKPINPIILERMRVLMEIVPQVFMTTVEEISGPRRNWEIVRARMAFSMILLHDTTLTATLTAIGAFINKDHSTICNYTNKHIQDYKFNYKNYRIKYQKASELYTEATQGLPSVVLDTALLDKLYSVIKLAEDLDKSEKKTRIINHLRAAYNELIL
jgi:hypothetical protein